MKALLTKIFSRVGIKKGFNVPLLPTKITKIIYLLFIIIAISLLIYFYTTGFYSNIIIHFLKMLASFLKKFVGNYNNGSKKLVSDVVSTLDSFYAYLDSLTLLEELALFQVLFFLLVLIIGLNILIALFCNEIINYFELENKYPKLHRVLKLRVKFQRYYLVWNIFQLFIICIVGIGLNLLFII